MGITSAPQRGPLGSTEVDLIKQIVCITPSQTISLGIDPINNSLLPGGIYNDFGGELRFSHARVSVSNAGYPVPADSFDGVTKVDIRIDGDDPEDSLFPADPITGDREYLSIRANVSPTWDPDNPEDPVTFVFEFPEDCRPLANGSFLKFFPVAAPTWDQDNPSSRENMASDFALTIYAYPTGS